MDMKIIQDQKTLLPRREIDIELTFDKSTPKRLELKKAVAKKLGSKEELLIIREINNNYGQKKALLKVFVYDKTEDLEVLEEKAVTKKHSEKEQKGEQ